MPCRSGLEGLLLGLALQAEQPQLESQRTALLQQEEEQRLQLAALDTQVLQSLATSKASGHTLMPHQKCLQPGVYKATCQQIQHNWMSGGWVVCLVSSWQRLTDERTRCESMACAWQITEICRTSLHLLFCC